MKNKWVLVADLFKFAPDITTLHARIWRLGLSNSVALVSRR